MRKYNGTAILKFDDDDDGNAASEIPVTVRITSNQLLANLFSDSIGTPLSNPFLSDENGQFAFFVEDNEFDIIIAEGTLEENKITEEQIFDVSENQGNVISVFGRDGVVVAETFDYTGIQVFYNNATSGFLTDDVQGALDAMFFRGSILAIEVGLIEGRVTINEGDIFALDGRVTVNEVDIGINEGNIAANVINININAGAIFDLDVRVTDNEGDILALDSRITIIEGRVTVNEGDIFALDGRVTVNEVDIGINEGNIAANVINININAGAIFDLDVRVTDNEGDILALDGRVTINEADILSLQTDSIFDIVAGVGLTGSKLGNTYTLDVGAGLGLTGNADNIQISTTNLTILNDADLGNIGKDNTPKINTNLDTIIQSGFYHIDAGAPNNPNANDGVLIVTGGIDSTGQIFMQTEGSEDFARIFYRHFNTLNAPDWTDWDFTITVGNIQSEIAASIIGFQDDGVSDPQFTNVQDALEQAIKAIGTRFDDTTTGLNSENVQEAIEDIYSIVVAILDGLVFIGVWDADLNDPNLLLLTTSLTVTGDGTGATAVAEIDVDTGEILLVSVIEGGTGYTNAGITVNSVSGAGATFTVNIVGDSVDSVNVITGGADYPTLENGSFYVVSVSGDTDLTEGVTPPSGQPLNNWLVNDKVIYKNDIGPSSPYTGWLRLPTSGQLVIASSVLFDNSNYIDSFPNDLSPPDNVQTALDKVWPFAKQVLDSNVGKDSIEEIAGFTEITPASFQWMDGSDLPPSTTEDLGLISTVGVNVDDNFGVIGVLQSGINPRLFVTLKNSFAIPAAPHFAEWQEAYLLTDPRTKAGVDTILDNADLGNIGKDSGIVIVADFNDANHFGTFSGNGNVLNSPPWVTAGSSFVFLAMANTNERTMQLVANLSGNVIGFRTKNIDWETWNEIFSSKTRTSAQANTLLDLVNAATSISTPNTLMQRDANANVRANAMFGEQLINASATWLTTRSFVDAQILTRALLEGAVDQLFSVATAQTANHATTLAQVQALDAQNVKITGTQSIAGLKTFTSTVALPTSDVAGNAVNNTRLQQQIVTRALLEGAVDQLFSVLTADLPTQATPLAQVESLIDAIPDAPIITVFGRVGVIIAVQGDYTPAQVGAAPFDGNINQVFLVATATIGNHAATFAQVQLRAFLAGAADQLFSVLTAESPTQATPLAQVESLIDAIPDAPIITVFGRVGAILAVQGDYTPAQVGAAPFDGNINQVFGVATATIGNHAATFAQVQDLTANTAKINTTNTFTLTNTFQSNVVCGELPVLATHLTRKSYVDDLNAANVKLTGDQTISGTKRFNSTVTELFQASGNTHLRFISDGVEASAMLFSRPFGDSHPFAMLVYDGLGGSVTIQYGIDGSISVPNAPANSDDLTRKDYVDGLVADIPIIKAGNQSLSGVNASFNVVFDTPFPNNNYAITIGEEASSFYNQGIRIFTKSVNGFTITSGTSVTILVNWIAIEFGH